MAPSAPTTLVSISQAISAPIPSFALISDTQMVPVNIVSSPMVTSETVVPVSILSLSSNSFSFPLHNGFYCISTNELTQIMLVLEVFSPVTHADVHSEQVEQLHRTSREGLEIPTVDDVTATLFDDVEHNHSSLRELVDSPKGSHDHVSHSSLVEHDDVHKVSVYLLQVQADRFVECNDVQFDSHSSPPVDRTIDISLVSFEAA